MHVDSWNLRKIKPTQKNCLFTEVTLIFKILPCFVEVPNFLLFPLVSQATGGVLHVTKLLQLQENHILTELKHFISTTYFTIWIRQNNKLLHIHHNQVRQVTHLQIIIQRPQPKNFHKWVACHTSFKVPFAIMVSQTYAFLELYLGGIVTHTKIAKLSWSLRKSRNW